MRFVSNLEASKILGVSQQTLRRYIKDEKVDIDKYSYSGRHLFNADRLESLVVKDRLSTKEAAKLLNITVASLKTCLRCGLFKKVQKTPGGRYMFDRTELLEVMSKFNIYPDTVFISKGELMRRTGLSYKSISYLQDIGIIKPICLIEGTPSYFRESDIGSINSYMERKDYVENKC